MELKIWVNSVQRVVCGVTPSTTCQDVVIALAQAMGRTGRFTLVERFRGAEQPLAATDSPVEVLQKWGEYAHEMKFVLRESSAKKKKKSFREPANNAAVALLRSNGHRATPALGSKPSPKTARPVHGSAIKKSLSFSGASFTVGSGQGACRARQPAKKLSLSGNTLLAESAGVDEMPNVENDVLKGTNPDSDGMLAGAPTGAADASQTLFQPTAVLRQQLQPAAAPRPSVLRQASVVDTATTGAVEVPRPPAPQRRTSRSTSLCGTASGKDGVAAAVAHAGSLLAADATGSISAAGMVSGSSCTTDDKNVDGISTRPRADDAQKNERHVASVALSAAQATLSVTSSAVESADAAGRGSAERLATLSTGGTGGVVMVASSGVAATSCGRARDEAPSLLAAGSSSRMPCGAASLARASPDPPHQPSAEGNGYVAEAAAGHTYTREAEVRGDRRLPRQSSRSDEGGLQTRIPKASESNAASPTAAAAISPAAKAKSAGTDDTPRPVASDHQTLASSNGNRNSSGSSASSSSGGNGTNSGSKPSSCAAHSSLFRAVTEELKGQQRSSLLPRPTTSAGSSHSSAASPNSRGSALRVEQSGSAASASFTHPTASASQASASQASHSSISQPVPLTTTAAEAPAVPSPSADGCTASECGSAAKLATARDRAPDLALVQRSSEQRRQSAAAAAVTRLSSSGVPETASLPSVIQCAGPQPSPTGAAPSCPERQPSGRSASAVSLLTSTGNDAFIEQKLQTAATEIGSAGKECGATGSSRSSSSSSGIKQSEEYQRTLNVVTLQERTLALQQSRLELLDKELIASQQKDRIRTEEAAAVRRLLSELEATCRCRDRELEQYDYRVSSSSSNSLLRPPGVRDGSPPSDCQSPLAATSAELEALQREGERIRAAASAERESLAECERSLAEHLQLADQLSDHVAACREQLALLTSAKTTAASSATTVADSSARSDGARSSSADVDTDDDAEYRRLKGLCEEERAALDRLEAECAKAAEDVRRAEAAVLAKRRAVETVELELRASGTREPSTTADAAATVGPERETSRAPATADGSSRRHTAAGGYGPVRSDADGSGLVVRAVAAKTAVVGSLPPPLTSAGLRVGSAASGSTAKRQTATRATKGASGLDGTYCH